MANPNPTAARRARARKRLNAIKIADLRDIQQGLSLVKEELLNRVYEDQTTEDICKLSSSFCRVAAEYTRIFQVVEIESRLVAIEEAQLKQRAEPHRYNRASA